MKAKLYDQIIAKQGSAQAIAALMNRHLQPKGITAKANLKDSCLQVMLEAAQVPNQRGNGLPNCLCLWA